MDIGLVDGPANGGVSCGTELGCTKCICPSPLASGRGPVDELKAREREVLGTAVALVCIDKGVW